MSKKQFITSILICSLATTSCKKDSVDTDGKQGQNINSFRVTQTDNVTNRIFPFITEPYRNTNLSFRVGGVIHQFDGQPGNFYAKGEVIASIDPRDYKVLLARAEADYKKAEAELKRIETLYHSNNIAASTYEKAIADFTSSLTTYQSAQYDLDDTQLVAPFDGFIQSVYIEQFQDVRGTQPVVSFIDINQIKIVAYVPQTIAMQLSQGQQVRVILDGTDDEMHSAKVLDVSKSTAPNNLSYIVTAVLDNPSRRFLAGMSGKLLVTPTDGQRKHEIMIPQIALRNKEKTGSYVWVVDSTLNHVEMRRVTIGSLLKEGFVSIDNGLSVGEVVATSGIDFLFQGCPINIVHYEN